LTTGRMLHPLIHDVIPTVIETGPRSERAFDIFSLLLKERIVFLGTPIDDMIANLIVAQLLYLQREDPERDISMYIHSPGGVITAGLAIYDTMQLIEPAVSTIAVGQTASVYVVDLESGPMVLIAGRKEGSSPSDVSELEAVMASIRFEEPR